VSDNDIDTETSPTDAQIVQDAPEPDEQVDDTGDAETESQDETGTQDDADDGRRRGVRQRLADAEAERDQLREALTAQRRAVWEAAVEASGVDGRLLASAGHTIDSLTDRDGILHAANVIEVAKSVADEFKVQPPARRPAPDPMVGRGEPGTAETGWGSVLKGALTPG